ncbi:MAG: transglutaminase domain-containing protein [Actinomycetota bacterium]
MSSVWAHLRGSIADIVPALFVVVGLVAAVTPLRAGFFEGAPYEAAALVSIVAVVVAAAGARSLPTAVNLVVGLVAGTLVLMVVLAAPPSVVGAPGDPGPIQVWRDVATGWSNLLAAPVPIEMSAQLLALPLALCWAAAYLSVVLVRSVPFSMVSALPLIVATVVLLLVGPSSLSVIAGGVIAASILAHVAVRAARAGIQADVEPVDEPGATTAVSLWRFALRSFAFVGVPALAVATLAGAGLAFVAAGDPVRTDLHDPAGIQVRDELTPLSRLRGQLLRQSADQLFTIQFDGASSLDPSELDRVRVATLEQYDGALWTSTGVFVPVVRRVRAPDQTDRPTVEVDAEVVLNPEYESSYLPITGHLRLVDGEALGLNEGSDTLVTGLEPGSSLTVSFTAAIPTGPRPTDIGRAEPPIGAGDARNLSDLTIPPSFDEFEAELVADVSDPVERLFALEGAMRSEENFGYSFDEAYSGHSLPLLATYLSREPIGGFDLARQGYGEQGAAAFTLLARRLNIPARVAVGYLLPNPQAAINGDPIQVTTDDAHAWTEVFLDGEWVTFDPTNRELDASVELDPSVVTPDDDAATEEGEIVRPPPPPPPEPETSSFPWRPILVALGVLVLVFAARIAKFIRRRLRHRGPPARQVVGAWRELRDRLRDLGVPVTSSSTPRDVAGVIADQHVLANEPERFAQIHDIALFSPYEPDAELASEAWASSTRLARVASSSRPMGRRLLGGLDPRSLRPPPRGRPTERTAEDDDVPRRGPVDDVASPEVDRPSAEDDDETVMMEVSS